MTNYDIRAAVRAVMDETDLTAPEDVAAKVAESIPANRLRTVLAVVLRDYVRVEFGRARLGQPAQAPATPSAKVRAIREAGPGWLHDRVFVGDSTWRLLGECTYENLLYLQSERLANAARSSAAAAMYRDLAELVLRHGVERVADLPREVLSGWRVAA